MSDIDPISVAERMLSRSNQSQDQDLVVDQLDPIDPPVEPKKHYSELPVCKKCQGVFFLAKEGEGGAITADPCGCVEKMEVLRTTSFSSMAVLDPEKRTLQLTENRRKAPGFRHGDIRRP